MGKHHFIDFIRFIIYTAGFILFILLTTLGRTHLETTVMRSYHTLIILLVVFCVGFVIIDMNDKKWFVPVDLLIPASLLIQTLSI